MEFSINSHNMINHWLLNSKTETVKAVADTIRNKTGHLLQAVVTVNGVELDFADFDRWLMDVYKNVYEEAREEFKDLDREVQKRLEKRLKEEAEPLIDKLHKLANDLEEIDSAIKPYWER